MGLAFHANCLQTLFSEGKEERMKNIANLSSAEFDQGMLKAKIR